MLSENDIKRAFLPFLKQFYKYRYEYRPDTVETELDKVSAGGLIADGMVSFRKEDGQVFVCTYEATSADKAEEVKFSLNVVYFSWDCLAVGAVIAFISYVLAYAYYLPWLASLQWTGNLGFLLGMGITGFLGWFFSMRGWKKYRYIYAIEQFKQYFADEQWVALADDVFPSSTDPYLQELRNQCIYNGFGLALVPEKGEIRVLNAPSRLGIFGRDRRMVQWVTRQQWFMSVTDNVKTLGQQYRPALPGEFTQYWNKIWRPLKYLLLEPIKKTLWRAFSNPIGKSNAAMDRFMRGQSVQKWVFAAALMMIAPFAYQVLTVRDDDVRDVVYRTEENPEDEYGYLYEGENARVERPAGIPKQYPDPVKPAKEEIQTINLSGDEDQKEVPTINLSGDNDQKEVPTINISGNEEEPAPANAASCATFRSMKGWIVQDNSFSNKTFADERAAALRRKGIECTVVPKNCLGEGAGYILKLGPLLSDQAKANTQAQNYSKAMERYGLLQNSLLARRIN